MIKKEYGIADFRVVVRFNGEDSDALLPSFANFGVNDNTSSDVLFTLDVVDEGAFEVNPDEVGQVDCGGANHGVYTTKDGGYQFRISDIYDEECCVLQTSACLDRGFVKLMGTSSQRSFALNNTLMILFAFSSSTRDCLLIHSSTCVNNNRGYMFLGHSGTGKSTHSRLWYNNIKGTSLLNDDNPVIRVVDGKSYVYGSPWSGKTPCYVNRKVEIGAIVRIVRARYNKASQKGVVESFASLFGACSVMIWDKRSYDAICSTVEKVVMTTKIFAMECLPDADAARVCYEAVKEK